MKSSILRLAFLPVLLLGVSALGASPSYAAPSKLTRVTAVLPFATSGTSYLYKLQAVGGTPPYRCVPQALGGVGDVALTSSCYVTGTAPTVSYERITGPFTFTLYDSGSPRQEVTFTGMNFTTKRASFTPQELDGTYSCSAKLTTTSYVPGKAPIVTAKVMVVPLQVVGGAVVGVHPISITNELGGGSASWSASSTGASLRESVTFTRATYGNGVSAYELGTVSATYKTARTVGVVVGHCHRTVIAK